MHGNRFVSGGDSSHPINRVAFVDQSPLDDRAKRSIILYDQYPHSASVHHDFTAPQSAGGQRTRSAGPTRPEVLCPVRATTEVADTETNVGQRGAQQIRPMTGGRHPAGHHGRGVGIVPRHVFGERP
jgi:hypothetical protein